MRVAALGAACLALGAAGASAAFLLAREDDRETPAAADATATETIVTTVVTNPPAELPAYIPETFRDRCRQARAPTPQFDESYVCRPGGPATVVRYSHAVAGPAIAAYFRRRLRALGLPAPAPPARIRATGSCAAAELPAVEEWELLVPGGHEIVGETLVNASDGRVLCHESDGSAHVEWNTADLGVYAHAYGPSLAPLLGWWETSAGPVT
jgi:hypothetical protein